MCWCTPELRTPNCGRVGCHPKPLADRVAAFWEVDDIVLVAGYAYKVTGVYLGSVGTVNLVGLRALAERKGNTGGSAIDEMLVPERILDAAVQGGACHTRNVI